MPRFSIVMPTRSRAHLLRLSLRTALEQSFDDVEVVISDNCSTDDTAGVPGEFGDPRVRYVRTETSLPMAGSWEFALSHARGDYVTFLSDDDALHPHALEVIHRLIEERGADLLCWRKTFYYHDSWWDQAKRGKLLIYPTTGEAVWQESRAALRDLFRFRFDRYGFPVMLNSCASRRVLQGILEQQGRLFIGSCPDVAASVALLANVERYLSVDRLFWITGFARESIGGANSRDGESARAFVDELGGREALYGRMPLRLISATNGIAETLLAVKDAQGERLADFEVDWTTYFDRCAEELATRRMNGIDTSADEAQFREALLLQPLPRRWSIRRRILKWQVPSGFARRATACLTDPAWVLWILSVQWRLGVTRVGPASAKLRTIDGLAEGLANIADCARAMPRLESAG